MKKLLLEKKRKQEGSKEHASKTSYKAPRIVGEAQEQVRPDYARRGCGAMSIPSMPRGRHAHSTRRLCAMRIARPAEANCLQLAFLFRPSRRKEKKTTVQHGWALQNSTRTVLYWPELDEISVLVALISPFVFDK